MRFRSTAIGLMSVMLLGASAPVAALPTVTIKSCYDGDTCTTTTGEKIRLACIDTPELKGENAKPAPAMAAKYHLNGMLMSQKVGIRRITTDRYGDMPASARGRADPTKWGNAGFASIPRSGDLP